MNQKLKSFLKFLLFLTIGIFLIWLSVHKLSEKDKHDIGNALQRADYRWLILSMVLGITSHISRAIRWKMLMEPLGHKPKTSNTFLAVMVGYLANYAIPRLGEVSRCGILVRYEKVPFTESFGTVVVERIVDVLCFFLVAFIVLLIQFDTVYSYLNEHVFSKLTYRFTSGGTSFYIILISIIVAASVVFLMRNKIMNLLGKKAKTILHGFVEGLTTIRRLKSPVQFIAHSLFIWSIYYVALHICFFCLNETKDLSAGVSLTAFLVSTLTIMITPGGLGAYPIAMASILMFYNIDFSIGTAIGWFVWLGQFVTILILGLLSLILLPILNKESSQAQNPS